MLEELPKAEITIKDKELKPIFDTEQSEIYKAKMIDYLQTKHNIDWDKCSNEQKFKIYTKFIKACKLCPIRSEATYPVPPKGPLKPIAMFIGRNPGKQEDREGQPFYPESPGGKLFEKYLNVLGLSRGQIYLTNSVMCYTKNDRSPFISEINTCNLWKTIEFDIIEIPRYIFTLGNDAMKMFFGYNHPSILQIYGDIYRTQLRGKETYIIPVAHPGFLLRNPSWRKDTQNLLQWVRINILEAEGVPLLPPIKDKED